MRTWKTCLTTCEELHGRLTKAVRGMPLGKRAVIVRRWLVIMGY